MSVDDWEKHGAEKKTRENLHTVIIVIANDDLFNLAKLAHFAPKVLVKGVKVVLQLGGIHLALWIVGRVLIQVWQENRL